MFVNVIERESGRPAEEQKSPLYISKLLDLRIEGEPHVSKNEWSLGQVSLSKDYTVKNAALPILYPFKNLLLLSPARRWDPTSSTGHPLMQKVR